MVRFVNHINDFFLKNCAISRFLSFSINDAKLKKNVTICNSFQKRIKQPKMRFWIMGLSKLEDRNSVPLIWSRKSAGLFFISYDCSLR